jgi:hypothetical protein
MQVNFAPNTVEFGALAWLFNRKTRVLSPGGQDPEVVAMTSRLTPPPEAGVVRGEEIKNRNPNGVVWSAFSGARTTQVLARYLRPFFNH